MSRLYAYTARNVDGRFVAGALEADSVDFALSHLRTRSLFVTSLEPRASVRGIAPATFSILPVSSTARLAFFRALATLLHAGVPMRRALDVTIAQCADRRLQEALQSVVTEIESGATLSAAMARRPREFSSLFIAMVRAGETGGVLDEVLERLAGMLEREHAVRRRLGAALAYPAIVACASIALVLFLVANIVPAFAALFTEMHVTLPVTTKLLIASGNALHSPSMLALLTAVPLGIAVLIPLLRRQRVVAKQLDRFALAFPLFGGLLRKALISRIARTLGTLLRSGVPLLTALTACEDVAENVEYAELLWQTGDELHEGHPISKTLEASRLFDPIFMQLVRVGEETGTLDAMLVRIADYFDIDVESGIAALGSNVEPLLIIVLGAVVGTIVASVLVPLYSVIGSIK